MKKIMLCLYTVIISLIACSQSADNEEQGKDTKRPNSVFIGDSITEFWLGLRGDFFMVNSFIGKGIGGQTSTQIRERFYNDVINLNPKSVSIMAGTNDIAQNQGYISNEQIMNNIQLMCEMADRAKIKVLLCSVLPAYQFGWNPSVEPVELIKDLNSRIKAYAEEKSFTYIDYYSVLVDERGGLPAKYSNDGVHPNVECYKIMEKIFLERITKIIDL